MTAFGVCFSAAIKADEALPLELPAVAAVAVLAVMVDTTGLADDGRLMGFFPLLMTVKEVDEDPLPITVIEAPPTDELFPAREGAPERRISNCVTTSAGTEIVSNEATSPIPSGSCSACELTR